MMCLFKLAVLLVIVSLAAATYAQDWAKAKVDASPRHLEWASLKHGDRTVKAFVAYPEVSHKATVVLLIHEIFGMTDWVQLVADQLAAAGYIVVAPDFLSGMGPSGGGTSSMDPGKVREAMSGLAPDQVDADLDAAYAYAKGLPSGNGKVVVAGFCWGGTSTFRYATHQKGLSAAFVFYGTGPTDEAAVKAIQCPVYGFYGGNDMRVNGTIPDSEKLMKANGKPYEPVVYEGAGHGFMRAGQQPDAEAANAKAQADGWKRWMDLLAKIK